MAQVTHATAPSDPFVAARHGRRARRARSARFPARMGFCRGCASWSSHSSCSPTTRSTPRATCRPGYASMASTSPRRRSGPRHWRRRASSTSSVPAGSAFVIGEAGLTTALHEAGYTLTDRDPDYVVLGETRTYSFEQITRAIRLVLAGARFIATNPDPTGPIAGGPAAGDRLGGGPDQPRHRRRAVLHRQAQPADDALGAERPRRPLGDDRR